MNRNERVNECNRFDGSIVNRPTDGFDGFVRFVPRRRAHARADSIETVLVASRVLSFPLGLSVSPPPLASSSVECRRRRRRSTVAVGTTPVRDDVHARSSMGDIDGRLRASARRAVEVKNTPPTQTEIQKPHCLHHFFLPTQAGSKGVCETKNCEGLCEGVVKNVVSAQ